MKGVALVLCMAALAAFGDEPERSVVTNLDSNVVSTRQWKRHYIMRSGAGDLVDATGVLATYAKVKTMEAVLDDIEEVTTAAFQGMQAALDQLYALTNNLPDVGCSLKLALQPDSMRQNFWAYIAAQTTDGTNDTAWVWFSQELETPPKLTRRYWGETETGWAEGVFPDGLASPVSTNGFSGCHRVTYERPAFAKGVLLVPDEYLGIGAPDRGLSFASAIVTVDGKLTYTGLLTNSVSVVSGTNVYNVVTVDNGVITKIEDVMEDQ